MRCLSKQWRLRSRANYMINVLVQCRARAQDARSIQNARSPRHKSIIRTLLASMYPMNNETRLCWQVGPRINFQDHHRKRLRALSGTASNECVRLKLPAVTTGYGFPFWLFPSKGPCLHFEKTLSDTELSSFISRALSPLNFPQPAFNNYLSSGQSVRHQISSQSSPWNLLA